jgi:hypothetical protein
MTPVQTIDLLGGVMIFAAFTVMISMLAYHTR